MRNKEIGKLFAAGWKVKELALLFGLSQRTVQRALKENAGCK
jgi:AraC-like DNA-binding protein